MIDARTYFLEALRGGAYKYKDWIFSVFTVTEMPVFVQATRTLTTMAGVINRPVSANNYPYQLYLKTADSTELFYVDPDGQLQPLEWNPKEPLCSLMNPLQLDTGELANVREPVDTCYGNALINSILFIWPFGVKFDFITGRMDGGQLDKLVAERLTDYPAPGMDRDPTKVYVDELLRYFDAASSLAGLTQINVPSASPMSLTIDPAILKRRDELLAQYKDQLKDPAIIALIEKELTNMDKANFKNDPAGGFYIKDKSYTVTRKRAMIMYGAEKGFSSSRHNDHVIATSLRDGIDPIHFPAMIDTIRAGSYGRGKETELGGESVKYFYRIFQNTKIAEDDCKSTIGVDWIVTPDNIGELVGLWAIDARGQSNLLDVESLTPMIGRTVITRSPMYCHTTAPSHCARCVGTALARNRSGLHIAASDVGSAFMGASMSAVHGVALVTVRYDLLTSLS